MKAEKYPLNGAMMDVWHKSAFYIYFHPFSPKKYQHLVSFFKSASATSKKEKKKDFNVRKKRYSFFSALSMRSGTSSTVTKSALWLQNIRDERCTDDELSLARLPVFITPSSFTIFFFSFPLSFLCCETLHFGDTNPAIAHRLTTRFFSYLFL